MHFLPTIIATLLAATSVAPVTAHEITSIEAAVDEIHMLLNHTSPHPGEVWKNTRVAFLDHGSHIWLQIIRDFDRIELPEHLVKGKVKCGDYFMNIDDYRFPIAQLFEWIRDSGRGRIRFDDFHQFHDGTRIRAYACDSACGQTAHLEDIIPMFAEIWKRCPDRLGVFSMDKKWHASYGLAVVSGYTVCFKLKIFGATLPLCKHHYK
ncbi:hypothetical protein EJ05DRAFT_505211 [Pseudovirgaria hyperparasitica]|uniref:Uncharacterized protein n=1 Tax=Pseudovirgaria hyperparasitica TaxID=470096 RepID=A0A6A6VRH4_9PEZI|nr:uncharacterized protein EJ05DRAFT_505211 [Pseudovirgaria hyperparasitica]KAF2753202.1 hypothetical protein EJ05DRAFT_505211 [Pseudovirgaria hyperparasitica]